jgi:alginate O-acetyltransferase complex protein AlgI
LTFLAVVVAWVLFRAQSLEAAVAMFKAMAGMSGGPPLAELNWTAGFPLIAILMTICWFLPNTIEIFRRCRPTLNGPGTLAGGWFGALRWQPTLAWGSALALGGAFVPAKISLAGYSEFFYFQF